jgi:transcriptional regulator with XRE-family HTH domain
MPHEYNAELARCFGENVFLARRRAGISQEELGFRALLHRTEIGQIERGTRIPRMDTVIKLAGALELPPGDLMKGMAWKPPNPVNGRWIARGPGEG